MQSGLGPGEFGQTGSQYPRGELACGDDPDFRTRAQDLFLGRDGFEGPVDHALAEG